MPSALTPRVLRKLLVAALVVLLAALVPAKDPSAQTATRRSSSLPSPPSSRPLSEKNGPWQTIRNATLIDNPWNDGDSFHILANGTHRVFRLYFVDTPETDRSLSDRIRTQATYFNLQPAQIPALGERGGMPSDAANSGATTPSSRSMEKIWADCSSSRDSLAFTE
jgi:hypothetical protein